MNGYTFNRRSRPHLRCGICDEPIAEDAKTTYVDDERCHFECAQDEAHVGELSDEYPREESE